MLPMHRLGQWLLAGLLSLSLLSGITLPAQAATTVAGPFRDYYAQHEGMRVLGSPRSELVQVDGHPAQYFEKGRLEDHRGETSHPDWAFMYGRLTAEVMERAPQTAVNSTSITYADLAARAQPRHRLPGTGRNGVTPATSPTRGMFVPYDPQLRNAAGYVVPSYFWDYINRADLFPGGWLHDIGLPMTPAFTVSTVKNGQQREIATQAFERTVLTYDSENPTAWPVERGNLGSDAVAAGFVLAAAPRQAVVSVDVASIRRGPSTTAERVGTTYARHIVHVKEVTLGEPVDGDRRWYQLTNGSYISATVVQPFTPPAPPRTWTGRWIDVNLSHFYITAYEGDTPLYTAIITAGRGDRTPKGIFTVQRRVRSETMDSATVGIPKGHPEYYYLTNVEYTQYFLAGGFAIHGNYWVSPDRFGRFSSNGCVGLMNVDAAYFWQFATIGTPIHIHF